MSCTCKACRLYTKLQLHRCICMYLFGYMYIYLYVGTSIFRAAAHIAGKNFDLKHADMRLGSLHGLVSVNKSHRSLCATHRAPQLLEKHMQAAAALVLGAFQEQHAGAHPNMWEMVLAFVKAYPSAWHAVDMRKAVLPRLLAFLRSCTTACTHTVCLASKAVPMLRLQCSRCMCCPDC